MAGDTAEVGTECPADPGQVDALPEQQPKKPWTNKILSIRPHWTWRDGPPINNTPPTHDGKGKMKEYSFGIRVNTGKVENV